MINTFWIESKYINMLSNKLDLFKNKGKDLYNFRCPICGDSERNKFKARGFIFAKEGTFLYKCHNCSVSTSFRNFLKDFDNTLYAEYLLETKANANTAEPMSFKTDITKFARKRHDKFGPLKALKKVSQLNYDHFAKEYVSKRMIPNIHHSTLYFAPKFNAWINKFYPDKIGSKAKDEPRLVIPFLDENGYVFGVQGRALLKGNSLRYITIMFQDKDKIFGLDRLKENKIFFITEGPLDSLFLHNAIAMAGADTNSKYATNPNAVFIYDNEPRNKDIVKRMEACIDKQQKLVIWPEDINEKDINDIVVSGVDPEKLASIIESRIFSGLQAKLELNNWKKI